MGVLDETISRLPLPVELIEMSQTGRRAHIQSKEELFWIISTIFSLFACITIKPNHIKIKKGSPGMVWMLLGYKIQKLIIHQVINC